MIVDCQTHFTSIHFLRRIEGRREPPSAKWRDGTFWVTVGPGLELPMGESMMDEGEKLREMDAHGVDISLLSTNIPGPERFEGSLGIELAQREHDELSTLTRRYPHRFRAVASLPLASPQEALRELDRAVGQLHLSGVQLFSNNRGRPLDSPDLFPLYGRMEELGVPVFLHPTYPVAGEAMAEYQLIQVLGFLLDTSLAMARLIFGGVMERFPRIPFVLPHLGSIFPYVMARIDTSSGNIPGSRERLTKPPSEYFREVYLDTVSLHPPALSLACEFQGTDKILFASDRPWWSLKRAVESIRELPLPARDKERIFSENALRLLRIPLGDIQAPSIQSQAESLSRGGLYPSS